MYHSTCCMPGSFFFQPLFVKSRYLSQSARLVVGETGSVRRAGPATLVISKRRQQD
jgi:hypothetical protein